MGFTNSGWLEDIWAAWNAYLVKVSHTWADMCWQERGSYLQGQKQEWLVIYVVHVEANIIFMIPSFLVMSLLQSVQFQPADFHHTILCQQK